MTLHVPITTPAEHCRRVALQHEIGRTVDLRCMAVDPACLAQTDTERVRELTAALGVVASLEEPVELRDGLVDLAALVQAWLEIQAREAAA